MTTVKHFPMEKYKERINRKGLYSEAVVQSTDISV
jgi:hypothetical protein